jgi:hypothetical protein
MLRSFTVVLPQKVAISVVLSKKINIGTFQQTCPGSVPRSGESRVWENRCGKSTLKFGAATTKWISLYTLSVPPAMYETCKSA